MKRNLAVPETQTGATYVKHNMSNEVFAVIQKPQWGDKNGKVIIANAGGAQIEVEVKTFVENYTMYVPGTQPVATVSQVNKANEPNINKESVKMNTNTMKKSELLTYIASLEAVIAEKEATIEKARVAYAQMKAQYTDCANKYNELYATVHAAPATHVAPVAPKAPVVNAPAAQVNPAEVHTGTGVFCKHCGRELTPSVISFCTRKLNGEMACMGCQGKVRVKTVAPQAPAAPATTGMAVLSPEVLARLKAEQAALKGTASTEAAAGIVPPVDGDEPF
jgi:hypothetical protein